MEIYLLKIVLWFKQDLYLHRLIKTISEIKPYQNSPSPLPLHQLLWSWTTWNSLWSTPADFFRVPWLALPSHPRNQPILTLQTVQSQICTWTGDHVPQVADLGNPRETLDPSKEARDSDWMWLLAMNMARTAYCTSWCTEPRMDNTRLLHLNCSSLQWKHPSYLSEKARAVPSMFSLHHTQAPSRRNYLICTRKVHSY